MAHLADQLQPHLLVKVQTPYSARARGHVEALARNHFLDPLHLLELQLLRRLQPDGIGSADRILRDPFEQLVHARPHGSAADQEGLDAALHVKDGGAQVVRQVVARIGLLEGQAGLVVVDQISAVGHGHAGLLVDQDVAGLESGALVGDLFQTVAKTIIPGQAGLIAVAVLAVDVVPSHATARGDDLQPFGGEHPDRAHRHVPDQHLDAVHDRVARLEPAAEDGYRRAPGLRSPARAQAIEADGRVHHQPAKERGRLPDAVLFHQHGHVVLAGHGERRYLGEDDGRGLVLGIGIDIEDGQLDVAHKGAHPLGVLRDAAAGDGDPLDALHGDAPRHHRLQLHRVRTRAAVDQLVALIPAQRIEDDGLLVVDGLDRGHALLRLQHQVVADRQRVRLDQLDDGVVVDDLHRGGKRRPVPVVDLEPIEVGRPQVDGLVEAHAHGEIAQRVPVEDAVDGIHAEYLENDVGAYLYEAPRVDVLVGQAAAHRGIAGGGDGPDVVAREGLHARAPDGSRRIGDVVSEDALEPARQVEGVTVDGNVVYLAHAGDAREDPGGYQLGEVDDHHPGLARGQVGDLSLDGDAAARHLQRSDHLEAGGGTVLDDIEAAAFRIGGMKQAVVLDIEVAGGHGIQLGVSGLGLQPNRVQRLVSVGQRRMVAQIGLGLQEDIHQPDAALGHGHQRAAVLRVDAPREARIERHRVDDPGLAQVEGIEADDDQLAAVGSGQDPIHPAFKVGIHAQRARAVRHRHLGQDAIVAPVPVQIDLAAQVVQVERIERVAGEGGGVYIVDEHAGVARGRDQIGAGRVHHHVVDHPAAVDVGLDGLLVLEGGLQCVGLPVVQENGHGHRADDAGRRDDHYRLRIQHADIGLGHLDAAESHVQLTRPGPEALALDGDHRAAVHGAAGRRDGGDADRLRVLDRADQGIGRPVLIGDHQRRRSGRAFRSGELVEPGAVALVRAARHRRVDAAQGEYRIDWIGDHDLQRTSGRIQHARRQRCDARRPAGVAGGLEGDDVIEKPLGAAAADLGQQLDPVVGVGLKRAAGREHQGVGPLAVARDLVIDRFADGGSVVAHEVDVARQIGDVFFRDIPIKL